MMLDRGEKMRLDRGEKMTVVRGTHTKNKKWLGCTKNDGGDGC